MKTQSGCFGTGREPDPIDDIAEAAEAMAGIIDSADQQTPTVNPGAAMPALAALVGQYARCVRMLTWAVALMAIVLVAKD